MTLNFRQIEPQTMELSVLEHLKNSPINLGKWCLQFFLVVFNLILLILAVNENMHLSLKLDLILARSDY